jgi:hypothetical protein
MKHITMIAVAVLAVAAVVLHGQQQPAQQQPMPGQAAPAGQRWEYAYLVYNPHDKISVAQLWYKGRVHGDGYDIAKEMGVEKRKIQRVDQGLDMMGAAGWELVGVVSNAGGNTEATSFTFKRPAR